VQTDSNFRLGFAQVFEEYSYVWHGALINDSQSEGRQFPTISVSCINVFWQRDLGAR